MKEHEAVCSCRTEKCRCDDVVEGNLMENHRALCPAVDVECPNSAFGCSFVIPRASLALHGKICQFAQVRPNFELQEEESRELKARLAFLEESTEAEIQYLRRRVQELERQNFEQTQRVAELVDQNMRLATGNAKANALGERPEELEKQMKEMATSEEAAERERRDLPRIPDRIEDRVNRLLGGPPASESSDKEKDAFRPRLADLARQNIELASQEVELKKQAHCQGNSLEGALSRSSELPAGSMAKVPRQNSGKEGGGQDVRKSEGREDHLANLPDALLHGIYRRLSQEDIMDAVRLSVCSKSLMSAFRGMPTQNFTVKSCRKVRSNLHKVVTSVLTKATNVQTLRVSTRALKVAFFCLHHVQHSLQTLVLENTNNAACAFLRRNFARGPLPAHTLHKLTSLKLFQYKAHGATQLLRMLKDLPLLKALVVSGRGCWGLEEELIISHPTLEDLELRLCGEENVAILGVRALRRMCLSFDGRLYLEMPKCLQSVHFKGTFSSCITGGGRKVRAAYLAENSMSGPVADLSSLICESEAADCDSGLVDPPLPRPAMQSVILDDCDHTPEFGNVDAFFADTSCLEVMHLEEWVEGIEKVPHGPFPRLKDLRVPLMKDLLDKFATAGNLPVISKFSTSVECEEAFRENFKSLEALLSAPLLREVVFAAITEGCQQPSSFLNWSAHIEKRHSKISVSFTGDPGYRECCLCGPDCKED